MSNSNTKAGKRTNINDSLSDVGSLKPQRPSTTTTTSNQPATGTSTSTNAHSTPK